MGLLKMFFSFFSREYKAFDGVKVSHGSNPYKSLNDDQITSLETIIIEQEVHDVIWACGSDKSPHPNVFTFAFFKIL